MASLDKQYRVWADNKTEENLNDLLQSVTNFLKGSEDEAAFIAQEVCLEVWQSLDTFEPQNSSGFKNWVSTLARLERKTLLKQKTRELAKREFFTDDPEDDEDGLTSTEKMENVMAMQARKEYDTLAREQGMLAVRAEALTLHPNPFIRQYAEGVLDEKTDQQIAEEMGISYGALREKLRYWRKKFSKT